MATSNELRQLLQEDGSGKNLYDHLTETLMRIVLDRPSNAYDDFERISAEVKSNPLNPNPPKGQENPFTEEEVRYYASTYEMEKRGREIVALFSRCSITTTIM